MRKLFAAALIAVLTARSTGSGQQPHAGSDWSSYLGNDAGTSYSPLEQINRENVSRLAPVWKFSTGDRSITTVPVVVDGVMYLTGSGDKVYALDAATGTLKWTHSEDQSTARTGRGSSSVAVGFGLIYYGTSDNHLVALDAATGRSVWDVQIEDRRQCGCGPSNGILIVKDKVVVGVRGDVAHRSYINAFDARTGRHAWRWWVIPGPGEPGHDTWRETSPEDLWKFGGGATWYAGSYDPKLNLIYWGTGNPQPLMGGTDRGAKLWTDSIVAIDADTGKMKWGFQETSADPFDFDSATEALLVDVPVNGTMTPVVVHSVKNGYTYVLNRATGAVVSTYPHVDHVTWTKGLDKTGKPIEPLRASKELEQLVCPSQYGSRAANHGAYSSKTDLWYGSSFETCAYQKAGEPGKLVEGRMYLATAGGGRTVQSQGKPFIAAFEPVTGKRRWTVPTEVPNLSSLMATAGDLVFGGDLFAEAWALDALTGKKLWSFNAGAAMANSPISYAVGGKQYIAIGAGGGGAIASQIPVIWPEVKDRVLPGGSTLFVFALPGEVK